MNIKLFETIKNKRLVGGLIGKKISKDDVYNLAYHVKSVTDWYLKDINNILNVKCSYGECKKFNPDCYGCKKHPTYNGLCTPFSVNASSEENIECIAYNDDEFDEMIEDEDVDETMMTHIGDFKDFNITILNIEGKIKAAFTPHKCRLGICGENINGNMIIHCYGSCGYADISCCARRGDESENYFFDICPVCGKELNKSELLKKYKWELVHEEDHFARRRVK